MRLGFFKRRGSSTNNTSESGYNWTKLLGDCSGGFIAALIALPYGMAMASLMGLPPVLGIFTSILTAPIITLLGRNPVLIGGTASATVPFILSAVHNQGIGCRQGLDCRCCDHDGVLRHEARAIRHPSPHAVVTGFSCGIGGMMVISQLDIIFGLGSPLTRSAGSPLAQLGVVLGHMDEMRLAPLVLAARCARRNSYARLSPRAPAPLIGIGIAFLAAHFLGLREKEVGTLSVTAPPFAGFSWSPSDVVEVLPQAFGLAFISSVNILITSRVVQHFRGRHKRMKPSDADAELGAYGIANIFAGIFGAPLASGFPLVAWPWCDAEEQLAPPISYTPFFSSACSG